MVVKVVTSSLSDPLLAELSAMRKLVAELYRHASTGITLSDEAQDFMRLAESVIGHFVAVHLGERPAFMPAGSLEELSEIISLLRDSCNWYIYSVDLSFRVQYTEAIARAAPRASMLVGLAVENLSLPEIGLESLVALFGSGPEPVYRWQVAARMRVIAEAEDQAAQRLLRACHFIDNTTLRYRVADFAAEIHRHVPRCIQYIDAYRDTVERVVVLRRRSGSAWRGEGAAIGALARSAADLIQVAEELLGALSQRPEVPPHLVQ